MKKGWDKYATKTRLIKKGYFRKYRNGNPVWKTTETSCSNCVQQSREVKEDKILRDLIYSSTSRVDESIKDESPTEAISWYGKQVVLTDHEIINTGEDVPNTNKRRNVDKTRRNTSTQSKSSDRKLLDGQVIPKKTNGRKRKTNNNPSIG